jgi:hypothetical protein
MLIKIGLKRLNLCKDVLITHWVPSILEGPLTDNFIAYYVGFRYILLFFSLYTGFRLSDIYRISIGGTPMPIRGG